MFYGGGGGIRLHLSHLQVLGFRSGPRPCRLLAPHGSGRSNPTQVKKMICSPPKKTTTYRLLFSGGGGGIRTLETLSDLRDFESRAFDQLSHPTVIILLISLSTVSCLGRSCNDARPPLQAILSREPHNKQPSMVRRLLLILRVRNYAASVYP